MILVDTGPLVALFDRSDPQHRRCREATALLPARLLTVWPVLTEAFFLLSEVRDAPESLWSFLTTGPVTVTHLEGDDLPRMKELMAKYSDLPMDLADAALVRVAERENLAKIFTLDQKHFSLYRPSHRRRLEIVP